MNNTIRNSNKKGLLIAVEGIDGSGKSTFCHSLKNHLSALSLPVLLTKEPGGTVLGKHIRQLLLNRETVLDPRAEYLLFAADRAQHCATLILPALSEGTHVISDRMADSSLVYQGYGHNLDLSLLSTINQWAMHNQLPDIVFYLSIDPKKAYQRILSRNKPLNDFEKNSNQLQQAADHFELLFKERSEVIKLDAELPIDILTKTAYNQIKSLLSTPITTF